MRLRSYDYRFEICLYLSFLAYGGGVKYYHFDSLCENEFLVSRREVKTYSAPNPSEEFLERYS